MILNHLYSPVVRFVDVLRYFHEMALADLLELLVAESQVLEVCQVAFVVIYGYHDDRLIRFLQPQWVTALWLLLRLDLVS